MSMSPNLERVPYMPPKALCGARDCDGEKKGSARVRGSSTEWYLQRLTGDRHTDVDPEHARAEAVAEPLRVGTNARVDGGGVAVGVVVLDLDGLLPGRHAQHAQHRAEDLVVEALLGLVREDHDGGAEPVARRARSTGAAVHEDLGAGLGRPVHVAMHLVPGALVDDGTDLAGLGAELEGLGLGHDAVQQIASVAHEQQHGSSHAALAGATEGTRGDVTSGGLVVAVIKRHEVVLGTAEGEAALVESAAALVDKLGDVRRSHEAHGSDLRVVAKGVDSIDGAVHHLEDARRHTSLRNELSDTVERQRDLLRRLENNLWVWVLRRLELRPGLPTVWSLR
mmetsp:Transcript_43680/g.137125  ORF Transcript_43680/g.137125 Transcript_43680/m.137125 type:complete len:338 (+) Transcript_43680:267-1280(+)